MQSGIGSMSNGINSGRGIVPQVDQQPIQAQFDYLEKALVTLREDIQRLEGRLNPVLNIGPTRAEDSGPSSPQPQTSALTARLMHLYSLVGDVQTTVNGIHAQLEL